MLRLFSHSQPGDGLGAERCVSPPHLEVYEMWRGGGLPHLKLARLPTFLPPLPRWVWGLQHTTLAHSLLMVSCTPLLIAGWAGVTGQPLSRMEVGKPVHTVPPHPARVHTAQPRAALDHTVPPRPTLVHTVPPRPAPFHTVHPPPALTHTVPPVPPLFTLHRPALPLFTLYRPILHCSHFPVQVAGTALGLMGGLLLAASSATLMGGETAGEGGGPSVGEGGSSGAAAAEPPLQRHPHLSGDLASLAAAVAIVGYLAIGRKLRQW